MNTITINALTDMLAYPFFTRALVIGGLISIASAFLGVYVVLRKESLIGHTIGHVSLLGIALGLALGFNLDLTTVAVAACAAIFIAALQSSGRFSHDSVLAFTAEVSLAGAIFIISRMRGYRTDLSQYLFGDILGITRSDVVIAAILVTVVLSIAFLTRKQLLRITFSEELAISAGTNIFLFNTVFTLLVAVTIAVSIKIVGIILIAAFLIIPANIGKIVARSFRETLIVSAAVALLATVGGLFASLMFDAPSGAMIVLTLGALLALTALAKRAFATSHV